MKLKALCFLALLLATVLVSSAATETSEDEKKDAKEAGTVTAKGQAAEGTTFEDRASHCRRRCCSHNRGCYCCRGSNGADVVYELNEATGQYVLADYGRGGWGEGGRGGGGSWGGGGRGGGGSWGGGGRGGGGGGRGGCYPHCTAEEAYEQAREGKP